MEKRKIDNLSPLVTARRIPQFTIPFDWEARTQSFADHTNADQSAREQAQDTARYIQGYVDYAREMI